MNTKRIIIVVLVILVFLFFGVGIYFLFFNKPIPSIVVNQNGSLFEGSDSYKNTSENQSSATSSVTTATEVGPRFYGITSGPITPGLLLATIRVNPSTTSTTTISKKDTFFDKTYLYYVERASGNLYQYDIASRTSTRISNRTLPGIQEAVWTPDGKNVFLRFLSSTDEGDETIDTYALPATGEGGYFLEKNLDQVLVTGSSTVVTLLTSSTGSIATNARIDGSNPKTFFSSNLSSLRLVPAGKNMAAYTKASGQIDGFGFMINPAGVFTRILGPIRGLTLLPSPSGKQVVYSGFSGNTLSASILDTATRTTTVLPIAILPEKCVWTQDEKTVYCAVPRSVPTSWPDSWYQGSVSFSDRIWKIDLDARLATLVLDPVTVGNVVIDAVSLTVDSKNDILVFTNKKDGSLWLYDL